MAKAYKAGFQQSPSFPVSVYIKGVNKTYNPANFYVFQTFISLTTQPGKVKQVVLSRRGKSKTQWQYTASTVDNVEGTVYYVLMNMTNPNLGKIPILNTGLVALTGSQGVATGSITKKSNNSFLLAIVPNGFWVKLGIATEAGEVLVEMGWAQEGKTDNFSQNITYIEVASSRFFGIKLL